jgi:hypothetical protein
VKSTIQNALPAPRMRRGVVFGVEVEALTGTPADLIAILPGRDMP